MGDRAMARLREHTARGAFFEGTGHTLKTALIAAAASGAGALVASLGMAFATPAEADDSSRARIVVEAQAELDAVLGAGKGFVIDPGKDTGDEIAMMYAALEKSQAVTVECVVMGGFPSDDAESLFAGAGFPVEAGDISTEDVQTFLIYRQMAHCYGDATPAQAEMFAVMNVLKRGASEDFLAVAGAMGELVELKGIEYPRFGAAGSAISRLAESMDGTYFPALVETSDPVKLLELAQVVNRVHDVHGTGHWLKTVGEGIGAALAMEAHYVPVRQGMVSTDAATWLESVSTIPEIARIAELTDFLSTPAADRGQLPAFEIDRAASTYLVSHFAALGDPAARLMGPSFGVMTDYAPQAIITDFMVPDAGSLPGELLPFDREAMVLRFSLDGTSYQGSAPDTGKQVLGGVRGGITGQSVHYVVDEMDQVAGLAP